MCQDGFDRDSIDDEEKPGRKRRRGRAHKKENKSEVAASVPDDEDAVVSSQPVPAPSMVSESQPQTNGIEEVPKSGNIVKPKD